MGSGPCYVRSVLSTLPKTWKSTPTSKRCSHLTRAGRKANNSSDCSQLNVLTCPTASVSHYLYFLKNPVIFFFRFFCHFFFLAPTIVQKITKGFAQGLACYRAWEVQNTPPRSMCTLARISPYNCLCTSLQRKQLWTGDGRQKLTWICNLEWAQGWLQGCPAILRDLQSVHE